MVVPVFALWVCCQARGSGCLLRSMDSQAGVRATGASFLKRGMVRLLCKLCEVHTGSR